MPYVAPNYEVRTKKRSNFINPGSINVKTNCNDDYASSEITVPLQDRNQLSWNILFHCSPSVADMARIMLAYLMIYRACRVLYSNWREYLALRTPCDKFFGHYILSIYRRLLFFRVCSSFGSQSAELICFFCEALSGFCLPSSSGSVGTSLRMTVIVL